MYYIAHRGNINGESKDENHPDHINKAVKKGFNVEIDVWYNDRKYILGHDAPQYEVEIEFLKNNLFWCHAKNLDALNQMLKHDDIHCFWHQQDQYTLTSKKYIWAYPGQNLTPNTICVMPEKTMNTFDYKNIFYCEGICSDYINFYKEIF